MRKLILAVTCMLYSLCILAQDTVTVHHIRYSTTFDKTLRYPVLVHWIVTPSDICSPGEPRRIERKSASFRSDPQLRQYTLLQRYYDKSGYQRGHNMNAADNSCDLQQMKESFYFSNMTPQTKELNENTWGDLEDDTRKLVEEYGKVEIWCGSYAFKEKMGIVTVPMFCWKIIKYGDITDAYIFPNHHFVNQHPYKFYKTTVNSIREASKLILTKLK
ncbi:DNA/RNA non-specific endonuclease [Mucilaginibacter sp. JRF]|uniref:DNA/RNA non-specific endonuclease n=1 Tax=Mucilaginibacter sp. JRF TaxID=2780088 RepID=UPI00187EF194|nr:DNA/RNA non-specific endonuclease [Mucilaginibacter sp. JRF]MBE9584605.1 DNA/RNA non-specific endonuclease [Mucilaginibacter sp. JRF]